MPDGNVSKVFIKLDGLLLYRFDEAKNICEIKIHTAAKNHEMTIKVEKPGKVMFEVKLSQKRLKGLHPLSIFVGEGSGLNATNDSATKGAAYDLILDLEGDDFYKRPLEIKRGKYGCSLFLHNGTVEAGNRDRNCFRVEQAIFSNLKPRWKDVAEFEAFKETAIQVGRTFQKARRLIMEFGKEIASDVSVDVTLKEGQALRFFSGKTKKDLFPPFEHGEDYVIDISYLDIIKPATLADDVGFAHHSAAMRLKTREPIFGLFKPIFPNPAGIFPVTDSGCCISCRISPPADDPSLSSQTATAKKRATKKPAKKSAKKSAKKPGSKKAAKKSPRK